MYFCRDYEFEIVSLKWERTLLSVEIETDCNKEIVFVLARLKRKKIKRSDEEKEQIEKGLIDPQELGPTHEIKFIKKIDLKYTEKNGNRYKFEINLSSVNNRAFLDNGQWRIGAYFEENFYLTHIQTDLAYKLDEFSRIFRYGKDEYAYTVSFKLRTMGDEKLEILMLSYFMSVNDGWKKRKYKNKYSDTVRKLIGKFYKVFNKMHPKNGKNILFMTETKEYIWGNLKSIDDRMKERGLDKMFNVQYSYRNVVGKGSSISSWIKTVWNISKQDFIFVDDYVPIFEYLDLDKKTVLVQVWHAGEGFKSVGYTRFGKAGSPYPGGSCHRKYTYALTGSKRLVDVYSEVFGIEKEAFMPVGMPRLDNFLDEKTVNKFKSGFYKENPQLKGKKIILFAPTFRGTGQKTAYYQYDRLDLEQIYNFCGDEYIFIVKMHPFIKKGMEIPDEYKDRIIDFSDYQNINDLYYITDILITDYSSNYFEFALLKKPIIFYTYDRVKYELTRGVHKSIKENAPGKVCDTFEELMEVLKNKDYDMDKTNAFIKENFGEYDGHASDKVINQILLKKENADE